jgi:hypothetical protein
LIVVIPTLPAARYSDFIDNARHRGERSDEAIQTVKGLRLASPGSRR